MNEEQKIENILPKLPKPEDSVPINAVILLKEIESYLSRLQSISKNELKELLDSKLIESQIEIVKQEINSLCKELKELLDLEGDRVEDVIREIAKKKIKLNGRALDVYLRIREKLVELQKLIQKKHEVQKAFSSEDIDAYKEVINISPPLTKYGIAAETYLTPAYYFSYKVLADLSYFIFKATNDPLAKFNAMLNYDLLQSLAEVSLTQNASGLQVLIRPLPTKEKIVEPTQQQEKKASLGLGIPQLFKK